MKKLFVLLILIMSTIQFSHAYNYQISFTASGVGSVVDSVTVMNLTQNTQVIVPGGGVLVLTEVVSTETTNIHENADIMRVINGNDGEKVLTFFTELSGEYRIAAYDCTGKSLLSSMFNLLPGLNSFELSLPQGLCIINITGKGKSYTTKLNNPSAESVTASVKFTGNQPASSINTLQRANSEIIATTLNYKQGDRLIYRGRCGNYTTLVGDTPTDSKTINFEFVECKDAAGKHYAVTIIGKQVWMAENLDYLPVAESSPAVGSEDSGNDGKAFYYVYNRAKYGVLYNYYAALTAAPVGWHLPSDDEWTTLGESLGDQSVAGGKMKTTIGWCSPNMGATNSSCFSALPGGERSYEGFSGAGCFGYWWTSNTYSTDSAFYRTLQYFLYGLPNRTGTYKFNGYSVRCVKDWF